MKVVFVSNYLTHHQLPFCRAMNAKLGREFCFIETEEMDQNRIDLGWQLEETRDIYLIKSYTDEKAHQSACKVICEADAVIIGGAKDEYIEKRLQENTFIIRYEERIFKKSWLKILDPRILHMLYVTHIKNQRKRVYMLCASAYLSQELRLFHLYKDKMFKWGYFPEAKELDKEALLKKHKAGTVSLMWAGRFIDWKHPELPVLLAEHLKEKGYAFHLSMVGGGEMENEIRRMILEKKLEKEVTLCGYRQPWQVREMMEKTEIYLFTSDYKEGWGAVLNEAMNSGCAVLASHAIGAVPFLLQHRKNGLIFESGNLRDMEEKAEMLLKNTMKRKKLGEAAYETIIQEWNAKKAADRLVELAENLLNVIGKRNMAANETDGINIVQDIKKLAYKEGPLSVAEVIAPRKMYRYLCP